MSATRNSRLIKAAPEAVYRAFTDPEARTAWLAPEGMTAKLHRYEARAGGGYTMSLYYPPEGPAQGKTAAREDRFTARFLQFSPRRIVEAVTFDTRDPAFQGEMLMMVTLEPSQGGTLVTFQFEDIPPGIRPEDNAAGTESSLGKLARYVEGGGGSIIAGCEGPWPA